MRRSLHLQMKNVLSRAGGSPCYGDTAELLPCERLGRAVIFMELLFRGYFPAVISCYNVGKIVSFPVGTTKGGIIYICV